ncbi:MAG: ABC transporter substrate-binding protein, partial [Hydrococcus sp. Prado102]|nr:ABC transporter substrate-binding protein [Hydrococcus sp. Prado102]
MFRNWITRFLALLCCIYLIACNSSTLPAQPNTNEPIKFPNSSVESAQRVIALTSLTADIIERLDSTKLAGIAGSSLLKKDERFQNVPQVSEGQTPPNLEKIVALKPDLVIGAKGFSDLTLNKLKELGISTLSTNIDSWNALIEITQSLAQIIGADPTLLLDRYQTFLNNDSQSSPSTLVLVSRQPILAPNQKSWAGDLLTKFKVKNVAAELQGNAPIAGYVTLSPEKILQENPELLLIVEPMGQKLLPEFKAEPFWKQLKATQRD